MKTTITILFLITLISVSHKPQSQASVDSISDDIESVKREISESAYNIQRSTEVIEASNRKSLTNAKAINQLKRYVAAKYRANFHVKPLPVKEPVKPQPKIVVPTDTAKVKRNLFHKFLELFHEKD